jgi:hypothetical protein
MTIHSIFAMAFRRPEGIISDIIEHYMDFEKGALNVWAVHQLQLTQYEKVLEIRYGSGVAIHEMAMIAKGNFFFIP